MARAVDDPEFLAVGGERRALEDLADVLGRCPDVGSGADHEQTDVPELAQSLHRTNVAPAERTGESHEPQRQEAVQAAHAHARRRGEVIEGAGEVGKRRVEDETAQPTQVRRGESRGPCAQAHAEEHERAGIGARQAVEEARAGLHVERLARPEAGRGAPAASVVAQLQQQHVAAERVERRRGSLEFKGVAEQSVHEQRVETRGTAEGPHEEGAQLDPVGGDEVDALSQGLRADPRRRKERSPPLKRPAPVGPYERTGVAALVGAGADGEPRDVRHERRGHEDPAGRRADEPGKEGAAEARPGSLPPAHPRNERRERAQETARRRGGPGETSEEAHAEDRRHSKHRLRVRIATFWTMPPVFLLAATLAAFPPAAGGADTAPLTVAERTDFRRTARSEEVLGFLDAVARGSDRARLFDLGESVEGRPLSAVAIADPPADSPAEARRGGRVVFFAFGAIHGGEVCGKEALCMLARDLASAPEGSALARLFERVTFVFLPLLNADGADRISTENRPRQVGPEGGVGIRANAQGLDLNRDSMKLESPEMRALAAFLNEWDPDVVVDTHTTNGSIHRFDLTFAPPQNPEADDRLVRFVRDELLGAAMRRTARAGFRSFFYGNFDRDRTRWSTYSAQPRFGTPYRGLRGHLAVLSEAYAYADFERRVRATYAFVLALAEETARRAAGIVELRRRVRDEWTASGPGSPFGFAHRLAAFPGKVIVPSWLTRNGPDGRPRPTGVAVDYAVTHEGRFEPTRSVTVPEAYWLPPTLGPVVRLLEAHGVEVDRIERPGEIRAEIARVAEVRTAERPFQGHRLRAVRVNWRQEAHRPAGGSFRVPVRQPLGRVAVYLLEPESDDGVATWNFLDPWLAEGRDLPVVRERPAEGGE